MGLHEFLRQWIETSMEDPKARDRKTHQHITDRLAIAKRMCAQLSSAADDLDVSSEYRCRCRREDWTQPTKSWGYWKDNYATAKFNMDTDPGVRSLPGRCVADQPAAEQLVRSL